MQCVRQCGIQISFEIGDAFRCRGETEPLWCDGFIWERAARRIYTAKSVDDIKESVVCFSSSSSLFAAAFTSYYVDHIVNTRSHVSTSAGTRRNKNVDVPSWKCLLWTEKWNNVTCGSDICFLYTCEWSFLTSRHVNDMFFKRGFKLSDLGTNHDTLKHTKCASHHHEYNVKMVPQLFLIPGWITVCVQWIKVYFWPLMYRSKPTAWQTM